MIHTLYQRSSLHFTPRFSLPSTFRRFIIAVQIPSLHNDFPLSSSCLAIERFTVLHSSCCPSVYILVLYPKQISKTFTLHGLATCPAYTVLDVIPLSYTWRTVLQICMFFPNILSFPVSSCNVPCHCCQTCLLVSAFLEVLVTSWARGDARGPKKDFRVILLTIFCPRIELPDVSQVR